MSAITIQFGRRYLTVSVARMPAFLWPGNEQYNVHWPRVSLPRHSATPPGSVSGTTAGFADERARRRRLRGRGQSEGDGERDHFNITGRPMPPASGRTAAGSTPNQSPHSAP